ncbi:MAG TPA: response regulator [Nitrospiraceae bacterium]|nr:response regulator [Nitrospiraceae bacterium]
MPENTHVRSGGEAAEIPAAQGLPIAPASHGTQSGSPTNRQWRVLLVDDDAVSRTLLRALLDEHVDLQVVGEASDGEEAVLLAEQARPDVILMDVRLPRVSGAEATRQINKKLPQSMIIGMSSLYTPHSYNAMMAAGAVAFVHKEDAVEALYKTLAFAMYTYYPTRRPSVFMTAAMGEWSGTVVAANTRDPFLVI